MPLKLLCNPDARDSHPTPILTRLADEGFLMLPLLGAVVFVFRGAVVVVGGVVVLGFHTITHEPSLQT